MNDEYNEIIEAKNQIIELINKAKDEIDLIKSDIEKYKEDTKEIKYIVKQLQQIETALIPKQKWFKERLRSLNSILEELAELRAVTMIESAGTVFELIEHNLIDGMSLSPVVDNEHRKNIIFDDEEIGYISIIRKDNNEIVVEVAVFDSNDIFELHSYSRVFSIISIINIKFNYQQI